MAPKNKNRDYAKEARWAASAEQKKRRAERNRARRKAMEEGKVKKGDGKEVHHTNGKRRGKLSGPTKVVSKATNRKIQPKRGKSTK
jgi:hypothetical protein